LKKENNLSIKSVISLVTGLTLLIVITSMGYLIFSNWKDSSEDIASRISAEMNDSINDQIAVFMQQPYHINEMNYRVIENGILDVENDVLRERFFLGVLEGHGEEVYSIGYGTVSGAYYGARRNPFGELEIMRNDWRTEGQSWYYAVDDQKEAGELVLKAGSFDPRTRIWFQRALETESPVFSPIYEHFIMNDLTITAAWPVYNDQGSLQGVMATHMLLSTLGDYLKHIIEPEGGYGVIIEKDTGLLVANSFGQNNFEVLENGEYRRFMIQDLSTTHLHSLYAQYLNVEETHFFHSVEEESYSVDVNSMDLPGVNWVVLTAVPTAPFMEVMLHNMYRTMWLAALAFVVFIVIYHYVSKALFRPVDQLVETAEALASGHLERRVPVVRQDEIGTISNSLNKVADKMEHLIHNLEETVQIRTEAYDQANKELENSKDQLQLILDSTAEAIYGMDMNGKCTFCNNSCVRLLGYNSQEELLGKNMHAQIHYSYKDGAPFPGDECKIFKSIQEGKGYQADDEVFWKADGTSIEVEYFAYPQIREGKIVGAVVTFMDITERKKKEEEIQYLNCHDSLTGLYNRRCFEENREDYDKEENLPLSVIFADINGLKMTNDIFGHEAGDELIKKSAEILKQSCRAGDMIARIGGDEFVILLPKTNEKQSKKVEDRIKERFSNTRMSAIRCSISIGRNTKNSLSQSLSEILSNAESLMYKEKTMQSKIVDQNMIDTLVETLHERSPEEGIHADSVRELSGDLAQVMGLSESDIATAKRAGYLHDIGKIALDERLLDKLEKTPEEKEEARQHSVIGYRILNLFDDTLDLADYVYSHHERWDGKGYPRGLKDEEIPLISRIIAIAEAYDRAVRQNEREAIEVIKAMRGTKFDPEVVDMLVEMVVEQRETPVD